ncbi:hypothetical protein [Terribacillus saccharophilus]|uniref:hypothetical protein n=1 Tax=Terribacillus saccharophilus TaxID=361277 RepID=UPI0039827C52
MLKKWMVALGMVSVLTLAACNNGDDEDPADDEQMEEQEQEQEQEQDSDDTEEDTDEDTEQSE